MVCLTVALALSTEWFDTSTRAKMHILGGLFFSFGYVSIAGLAYAIRQWRVLQLVISLVGFLFLPYFWLIPESARWLLAKSHFAEAQALMTTVAAANGTTCPKIVASSCYSTLGNESVNIQKFV
jgi:MFS family permease